MKKFFVFLAIFTFLGNQNKDENMNAEFNIEWEDGQIIYPFSPLLEVKYDTIKWEDGKNYIFLNVSMDYSYYARRRSRSRQPSLCPSTWSPHTSMSPRWYIIPLIGRLNRGRVVMTISTKGVFFNALTIKPTVSNSFIDRMKKRNDDLGERNLKTVEDCLMKGAMFKEKCWPVLQLNGLFLIDDFNRFRKDEKITVTLSIINEDHRRPSGTFSFKKEDIDLEKLIEPFDPDKFDPSIPKATRTWYRKWVREQKEQNSNQDQDHE